MSNNNLTKTIISLGQKRQTEELYTLIANEESEALVSAVIGRISSSECIPLWHYLLIGLDSNRNTKNKQFDVVKNVLKGLRQADLTTNQSFEMMTRLFVFLPKLYVTQLVQLAEFCLDCIRGDDDEYGGNKFVGWKDLLPEIMKLLRRSRIVHAADDDQTPLSGDEYRSKIVANICSVNWCNCATMTTAASMLREMKLTQSERRRFLLKVCCQLGQNVKSPEELPPLAYHLFKLARRSTVTIVPIVAFDKYYQKHFYHQLLDDAESESTVFDSIDNFSSTEFRQSADMVLFHLSVATSHRMRERSVVTQLKRLSNVPEFLLKPFTISALLALTSVNRNPGENLRLSNSSVLPFLRQLVENSEREKLMASQVSVCSKVMKTSRRLSVEQVINVLIDQSREGTDVVTPGLVGLAFTLLKSKCIEVHTMAVTILTQFVRKRFIFGRGVVQRLCRYLLAKKKSQQYIDCLTVFSLTTKLVMTEAVRDINRLQEHLLTMQGADATRMLQFLLPVAKLNHDMRLKLTETFRRALAHRNFATRKMGIQGLCMQLKQMRPTGVPTIVSRNSLLSQISLASMTSFSGFTQMSQSLNKSGPHINFDLAAMEILGILRKCFSHTHESRVILYDGLTRACQTNNELVSHVMQFLEMHFVSFFDMDQSDISIKFDHCISQPLQRQTDIVIHLDATTAAPEPSTSDDQPQGVQVWENLGQLTMCVTQLLMISNEHQDCFSLDEIMQSLLKHVEILQLEDIGISESVAFGERTIQLAYQYLGVVEALIAYCVLKKHTMFEVKKLFTLYTLCVDKVKKLSNEVKKTKKTSKKGTEKSLTFKPESIWTLSILENMIQYLFDKANDNTEDISVLKQHTLRTLASHLKEIKINVIDLRYSQSTFNALCGLGRFLLGSMSEVSIFNSETGVQMAEAYLQVVDVVVTLYKRKITEFFRLTLDKRFETLDQNIEYISTKLQAILEALLNVENPDEYEAEEQNACRSFNLLCQTYDHLVVNLLTSNCHQSNVVYKWLFELCTSARTPRNKDWPVEHLHKLLFTMRLRTVVGPFFDSVAVQMERIYGQIKEVELTSDFELTTLTLVTAPGTLNYLLESIKALLDFAEYSVAKARSSFAKDTIFSTIVSERTDLEVETIISIQLMQLAAVFQHLTNASLPLGKNMHFLQRLIIRFYGCATNLTKHLTARHAVDPVDFHAIKFYQMVKLCGRPLAKNIYELITYIDANNLTDEKSSNAQTDKQRVLRETRLLPQIIFQLENFNKVVILLSKRTTAASDIAKLLHIGTVRDFRIKTKDLMDFMAKKHEKSIIEENSDKEDTEVDNSDEEDENSGNEENEEVIEENNQGILGNWQKIRKNINEKRKRTRKPSSNDEEDLNASDDETDLSAKSTPIKRRRK